MIRKKLMLLLLLLGFSFATCIAQVQLQATLPVAGLVQKNQLWNLVLINGTPGDLTGYIELKLNERSTGLEVLVAAGKMITIKKGATVIQENMMMPIQYSYSGIAPDLSFNGSIPVGSYTVCYTYINIAGEKQEPLAEECFSFDVEPLMPPMLLLPADSSQLDLTPAQFSWIPPAPLSIFRQLRYDFILVEMSDGQLAAEAVQDNMPLLATSHLSSHVFSYNAAYPAIQQGKKYAWQVIARDGDSYAGRSEAWTFSLKAADSVPVPSEITMYAALSADPQRTGFVRLEQGRNLAVKHYSFSPAHQARLHMLTAAGEVVYEQNQPIRYGDNFLHIPVPKKLITEQVYTLVLTDESNKKYSIQFLINDQNKR